MYGAMRKILSPPISVKDHSISVTKNLHAALLQIASTVGRPLPLWVDAVCINQTDDLEESHQVHFMGGIYRRARFVFAWLGLKADDSDLALHNLEWLSNFALDHGLDTVNVQSFPRDGHERSFVQALPGPLNFGEEMPAEFP